MCWTRKSAKVEGDEIFAQHLMDDADIFRNEDSYFWSIRRGRFTRWTQQVSLTFGTCMKLKYTMIDHQSSFIWPCLQFTFSSFCWEVVTRWLVVFQCSFSSPSPPCLRRLETPLHWKTWSYVGWGVFTYWWDNDLRSRKSSLRVRFVKFEGLSDPEHSRAV